LEVFCLCRRATVWLGRAVNHEVHRVNAGHGLFGEKLRGAAFRLGEYGHEHLCSSHQLTTGGFDMDHRALDHALKGGGWLCLIARLIPWLAVEMAAQFRPQ